MMSGKSVIIVLVSLSVMVGAATAQEPELPRIVSWSNTKTADSKTVFAVNPGEKITFSVKADGAEKYVWLVDGTVQGKAEGASFTWTVPDKKGMWKILLKTTNNARRKWVEKQTAFWNKWVEVRKDRRGRTFPAGKKIFIQGMTENRLYSLKAQKEWIISPFLTRVEPGRSIQKAIDAIPPEGGIVELAPGVHEVSDAMYPPGTFDYSAHNRPRRSRYAILIKKNNVTIYGVRKSIVRHHNKNTACFVLSNPEATNLNPLYVENITFRGFTITSTYTRKDKSRECIILAVHPRNFTVEDMHDKSWAKSLVVAHARKWGTYFEGVFYKNNVVEHSGLTATEGRNIHVLNNTILGSRLNYALHTDCRLVHMYVTGNRVINAGYNSGMHVDGANYCFVSNNYVQGSQVSLRICQAINHTIIENNTFTGASKNAVFIWTQMEKRKLLIRNNLMYNSGADGIFTCDYLGKAKPCAIRITNNIIYNSGRDGIRKTNEHVILDVSDNIIANSKGYGINRAGGESKIIISHNDVWNSGQGNYNGCSAGPGDFSKDPLFVNPSKGDFHLKSKAGRWDTKAKKWVKDKSHSPCIDAGDPKADFSREPTPNGGRVNMGAYGNTPEASKSRPGQTKPPPSVKLWDVGEKHPWHNSFRPYAKQELWKQVPYGKTNHEFKGDAVIENEFFYLYFYRTITLHGKVDGKPRIWRNVLYKVHVDPSGRRNYGHTPPKYFKVLKNTPHEIIVEHQGGKSVTTTYRFPRNKPWFEVRGVKNATELGIHGKVRMALAPVESGNDFVVDSLRDPPGRPNAPGGKMIISFYENRTNPCMWVFTWTAPFKEAAPWFLNDSGPKGDTMWCSPGKWGGLDIPRKWPGCITSSWAKFGKNGSVVLGALVYPNNWHRQHVDKPIKKGQTYTSRWKPPYPGRWRMTARVAEKKYDQGFKYDGKTKFPAKYFSKDVYDGNFTFRSPIDGWLDYVIIYMYDRTKETPHEILTPMDQYRWTVKTNKKGESENG